MSLRLSPYPSYAESGLPWLGTMPAHWRTLRIKNVLMETDRRNGAHDRVLLSLTRSRGLIPHTEASTKEASAEDLSKYKVCQPGDLVMNRMQAWSGMFAAASAEGVVSPDYCVFSVRKSGSAMYFERLFKTPYLIESFVRNSKGIGSGFNRLYSDDFGAIRIPVPPEGEQAAIVRFLRYVERRASRAVRAKRELITFVDERKRTIVTNALTRGLDPGVRLKASGVPWIDQIPEHWQIRRAKQLCTAIVDCKNRTPEMVPGGEYTVIRTTNVRNGRFSLEGSYPTDRHNYEIWTQRGAPKSGDVFFTREAPVGEACPVPDMPNICMGQRMMYFRPDPGVLDTEFLLHSIYGPLVRGYTAQATNGSTVGHLRLGQVSSIPLLWCPIDEQRQIVRYLRAEVEQQETATSVALREIDLIHEYVARLAMDVVTGRVDVRELAATVPDEHDQLEPNDKSNIEETFESSIDERSADAVEMPA